MTQEELNELIDVLAGAPATAAALIGSLSQGDLRSRPSADEFSVLETICHLRDIEAEGYVVRINRILTEDGPSLADIDGTRLAIERDYNSQNLEQALNSFANARQHNVTTLRDVTIDQLSRVGIYQGTGPFTLESLVTAMREHDEDHLNDVRVIRDRFVKTK